MVVVDHHISILAKWFPLCNILYDFYLSFPLFLILFEIRCSTSSEIWAEKTLRLLPCLSEATDFYSFYKSVVLTNISVDFRYQ